MVLKVKEFPPALPEAFAGIPLNGGRVHAITVNPLNRRDVIISTQFGGLWKTTTGGSTWRHLRRLPVVFSRDVQYGLDGRTVVATVAPDLGVTNGGGIWVSWNGGSTWSRPATGVVPVDARTPDRTGAWGVTADADPRLEGQRWYVGTDYGLATSTDNGATWTHERVDATTPVIHDRMQDSVRGVLSFPDGQLLAMVRNAIHRSDDHGATWRSVRTGNFSFGEWNGWNKLDRSPYWPYAFILEDYYKLLLYELGSDRWTTLPLPAGTSSRGPFVRTAKANISGDYTTIYIGQGVRALHATRKRIGSLRALREDDWTIFGRGQGVHDDMGDLGVDSATKPVMIGSDGGLFKPAEVNVLGDIVKWRSAAPAGSGMNSYQITDVAGTNVPEGRGVTSTLYFATQDNAIWSSTDGGVTWPTSDVAEGFHVEVQSSARAGEKVTVAYGRVGGGPTDCRFADAGLLNQRNVPDVDGSQQAVQGLAQAFYVKPNYWIRMRNPATLPDGTMPPREIWVSSDNGLTWRHRFTTTLGQAGVFARSKTNYPAGYAKVYLPVATGVLNPDGKSARVGLIRLFSVFRTELDTIGDASVIWLPDSGSLGIRATEFDWQGVFGVHPVNWRFIIAPDIVNGDVKVSRDGGETWTTDAQLTDRVTRSGALMMYIDPYHMQVTHISFDPYNPNRILVGTRDAGIIASTDGGASWTTAFDSERVKYVTGFFFEPSGRVVVSTYGRGLWHLEEGRLTIIDWIQRLGELQVEFGGKAGGGIEKFEKLDRRRLEKLRTESDRRILATGAEWSTLLDDEAEPDEEDQSRPNPEDDLGQPRFDLRTTVNAGGTAVIGPDDRVTIWVRGVDWASGELRVDGEPTRVKWREQKDGSATATLRLPDELERGGHTIELWLDDKGPVVGGVVVKASFDDADDEQPVSRYVEWKTEPEEGPEE